MPPMVARRPAPGSPRRTSPRDGKLHHKLYAGVPWRKKWRCWNQAAWALSNGSARSDAKSVLRRTTRFTVIRTSPVARRKWKRPPKRSGPNTLSTMSAREGSIGCMAMAPDSPANKGIIKLRGKPGAELARHVGGAPHRRTRSPPLQNINLPES